MNPNLILSVAIGILAAIMVVRFFIDKSKANRRHPRAKESKNSRHRKGRTFDLSDYDKLIEDKKKQQTPAIRVEMKENQTPGAVSDQG